MDSLVIHNSDSKELDQISIKESNQNQISDKYLFLPVFDPDYFK